RGTGKKIDFGTDAGKIIAKYQKQGEITSQREGTITKSISAMFKDLYTLLDTKAKIQKLYSFDKEIWEQLKAGEFIEVKGELSQSPVELLFSSISDFTNKYRPLIKSTDDQRTCLMIQTFFESSKVTVIIKPYTDDNLNFFSTLDKQFFLEDRYELEGEYLVFGRVKKIYTPYESVDLIKLLPGKMRMPKDQLMSMIQKTDDVPIDVGNITEDSFTLKGPAIKLTPFAIYQSE
ncbi:MAG: hypothetical protein PHS56_07515, partial [Eubacteriales bacterium]|nr:hypothetical protein [Eubacteriales bacterium]